jgi:hypothetical protein
MPPRKPDGGPAEPPFYLAAEDLYVHHPDAGVTRQVAYREGDRVVPDVLDANGWREKVRAPDDETAGATSGTAQSTATTSDAGAAGTTQEK